MKITKKVKYEKFLEAVDTVCMECWFTGEDGEGGESCPVRKMCDELRSCENNGDC